jgi:hypothetical protein
MVFFQKSITSVPTNKTTWNLNLKSNPIWTRFPLSGFYNSTSLVSYIEFCPIDRGTLRMTKIKESCNDGKIIVQTCMLMVIQWYGWLFYHSVCCYSRWYRLHFWLCHCCCCRCYLLLFSTPLLQPTLLLFLHWSIKLQSSIILPWLSYQ